MNEELESLTLARVTEEAKDRGPDSDAAEALRHHQEIHGRGHRCRLFRKRGKVVAIPIVGG